MRNKDTVVFICTDSGKVVAESIVDALEKTKNVYSFTVAESLLLKRSYGINKSVIDTVYRIKEALNRIFKPKKGNNASTVVCEKKLENLFYRYTPSVVVTDSADVMYAYDDIKDKIGLKAIVVYYINELGYVEKTVPEFADFYFADNIDLKNELLKIGINSEKIYVEPIPCEDKCFLKIDKNSLKIKYFGNKNGTKVLIDGEGTAETYSDLFDYVADKDNGVSFTVYCGEDKVALKRARQKGLTAYDDSVDRIEAFASADVVISRGNTISIKRTAALNVPLIIYKPSSKAEKSNLKYLTVDKRAFYAQSVNDIGNLIQSIGEDEDVGFDFADGDSVNRIAENVIGFIPEV